MRNLSILIILIFGSCKVHKTYTYKDSDAGIYLDRGTTFNANSSSHIEEHISAGFTSFSDDLPKSISINSVELNNNNQYSIQRDNYNKNLTTDLFGHHVKILFDSFTLARNFYSPKQLYVSYDAQKYNASFRSGMVFTWTPDPKSNEMTVTLSVSPTDNSEITNRIQKTITIKDNGRFELPKKMVSDLPDNTIVRFSMNRLNTNLFITTSGNKILVKSISGCHGTFIVRTDDITNAESK